MTVGKDLVATFESKDLGDAITDLAEVGLDALIDSNAIDSIPVLGTLKKLGSAVGAFRDYMLAKKIVRFLEEVAQLSEQERVKVMEGVASSAKDRERVGEVIVDLIDKADATEKPGLIGKLFAAAGRGEISSSDVLRLSAIITRAYIDHLQLLQEAVRLQNADAAIKSALYANGLMSLSVRATTPAPPPGGLVSMKAMNQSLTAPFLVEFAVTADARTIARVCFNASI